MKNLLCINAIIDNVNSRRERWEGEEYLVFPVVALVEGVHNNSRGACYYPAEELARLPEAWNGIPVPVFHPEKNGELVSANDPWVIEENSVGRTFNFYYEDGKLKGEVWLNLRKVNRVEPELLETLNSGGRLEVSTGHFSQDTEEQGTWNGENYNWVLRNYIPDHLALLPGGQGACSWRDGCGIRVNKDKGGETMETNKEAAEILEQLNTEKDRRKVHPLLNRLKALFKSRALPIGAEASYEDTHGAIQRLIDAFDNHNWAHYVMKVYDNHFIYRAEVNPEAVGSLASKTLKLGYSIDENGQVTLSDEAPIEVMEKPVEFMPVNDNETNKQEDKTMAENTEVKPCCEEAVELLIENEAAAFTEDDREWLLSLNADQLKKVTPAEKEVTPVQDAVKAAAEKDMPGIPVEGDVEKYLAEHDDAPADLKAAWDAKVKAEADEKAGFVEKILANERNALAKEQLEGLSTDLLKSMAALAETETPKPNYTGNGGAAPKGTHNEEKKVEPLGTPSIDDYMTKKKD